MAEIKSVNGSVMTYGDGIITTVGGETYDVSEVVEPLVSKVEGATDGNFAGLDTDGNLTDSGKKAEDFANAEHTHSQYLTEHQDISGKQDKPSLVSEGTEITLADNTEYRLEDVSTLTLTYPEGSFEAWMRITTAEEGAITITLPTSLYIGDTPTFGNGETWEISIKDGVVIAGKAVSAI